MIFKGKRIEVPDSDPFKNDQLRRRESVVALTNLIGNMNDPMVLCINASWGQGKTTFLDILRQYLINSEFSTLHFNAWKNDFSDDALISLIGEIETGISTLSKDTNSKARIAFENSKKFGAMLAKKSFPAAIKLATQGVVDTDKIADALASLAEETAKEQIAKYEQSKQTMEKFRASLETFVKEFCGREESGKPLVFIIDELDRCRPDYAIELLEKAKHLFSVQGIVFVLAMDKEQLGHSIRSVYGAGMDIDGYLRRFIDIEYKLEVHSNSDFTGYLLSRFEIDKELAGREVCLAEDQDLLKSMMDKLVEVFDLSLREQEHCFTLISVAFLSTPKTEHLYPAFLSFLVVLKIKEPTLYQQFLNPDFSSKRFRAQIRSEPWYDELLKSELNSPLEAFFALCYGEPRSRENAVGEAFNLINNPKPENFQFGDEERYALAVLRNIRWTAKMGLGAYLVQKIEVASGFSFN